MMLYNKLKGELNGKTANYFVNNLDFNVTTTEGRLDEVNKILYNEAGNLDGFFEEYYDQNKTKPYFNPNPNKSGILSSDDPVSKELEKMANYLLFAPDGEKMDKKVKYNFYTEEKFKNLINRELKLDDVLKNENMDDGNYYEVIDYLIRKGDNYKMSNQQVIFKDDYKDEKLESLNKYQFSIDGMRKRLIEKCKKNFKQYMKYKLLSKRYRHQMKLMRKDQIDLKNIIKKPIVFKHITQDSCFVDFDMFDWFDKRQILALLKMSPRGISTDLGVLIYDMEQILNDINLDDLQKEIIRLWRDEDATFESIAGMLGCKHQNITCRLNSICKLVKDKFEEIYEDWYYLNIVKGKYKKCSRCNKIKLANERHFGKHPNTKDGFYPSCKICRQKEDN